MLFKWRFVMTIKTSQGFSLVEMVVVLIILGLLFGELLLPLSSQVAYKKRGTTQQRLIEIKEALLGFAIVNGGFFPFPANEEGQQDSSLAKRAGYLPWADLGGVGRYDAWGHPFRYRVADAYTQNQDLSDRDLRVSLVQYSGESARWLTAKTNTEVIAIIFSCGQNGRPDPTKVPTGETPPPRAIQTILTNDINATRNTNTVCIKEGEATKGAFVYNTYIENGFDDLLTWVPKNILISRLVMNNQWPPAISP